MDKLDRIIQNLEKVRDELPAIVAEILEEHTPLIEDMVIAQLDAGQRSDGSELPAYSQGSVRKFGKRPGPMTLENTGRYKRGITLKVDTTSAELYGQDPKSDFLQKKYGKPEAPLIALNQSNRDAVVDEIIRPNIREKLVQRLAQ